MSIFKDYIDNSIERLKALDLMKLPQANMPKKMRDESNAISDEWIPWAAANSEVTENDFKELESQIGFDYPQAYKDFLSYKHFYELDNVGSVEFYRHCVRDWKKDLLNQYFNSWEPDVIIKKGYIPIADYCDWGIVCLDANRMNDIDCPVVMFDHEELFDEPVQSKELFESFTAMIETLVKLQNEAK